MSKDTTLPLPNAGGELISAGGTGQPDRWLIPVLVAMIGCFMSILDSSIVNVAISTIMEVFNATTSSVEWVVTIYMLALGVVVPMSGWLGDKFGFKRLYIVSMALFIVGSLLCTVSWSLNSLIVARVVQAIGGGVIMPTTMAMVMRMVPKEHIGGGMAVLGLAMMVAPAIGPTLGGYLVEYVNWRWIFTINLPIGLIGIILSIFMLPDFPPTDAGKLDLGGILTSSVSLFCLLLALSEGASWGWKSEAIVLLLYTSAVCMGLFIYLELTTDNPLLDLRVFRYRTFTLANLMLIITTVGMYAGIFYLPLFLQTVRGLGAMQTGLLMMPGAIASGIMMPIVGRIYDRIGPKMLIITGLVGMAYMTYVLHNLTIETTTTTFIIWVTLRGITMAMANMPIQTAAMVVIPPELVGRASAMTNIVSRVSSSFGIAVLTSILTKREVFYTTRLSSHFTSDNLGLTALLQNIGGLSSQAGTLGYVYLRQIVARAAFVRGIDDIFIIAAGFALAGVVPVLFLKTEKQN